MKNADQPIHPASVIWRSGENKGNVVTVPGLTKREYFAGLAMHGLLAGNSWNESDDPFKKSIIIADELLNQLQQKQST